LVGLTALAQDKIENKDKPSTQTAADRDMGKLSKDGYKAKRDVSWPVSQYSTGSPPRPRHLPMKHKQL
jgi:hypothetical protein